MPVMPLVEVDGSDGTLPPEQMVSAVPNANMGVVLGVTVTFILADTPHWFGLGVNVYVPEFVLSITAGLQVPLIPLSDVGGSVGAVVPAQKLAILLNFGMMTGLDKISPVLRFVWQPLMSKIKSE